jgi:hypothetical protein
MDDEAFERFGFGSRDVADSRPRFAAWSAHNLHRPERAEVQDEVRTLGFSDKANLDQGDMWPTTYALTRLTAIDEARISALVKQAVS